MKINISYKNFSFGPGKILQPEQIINKSDKKPIYYSLQEAQYIDPENKDQVIIKGDFYLIEESRKQYFLTDKFGILAILKNNKIFPVLRKSFGKEIIALKKKTNHILKKEIIGQNINFWPIIKEI